jgi:hypothetical protein
MASALAVRGVVERMRQEVEQPVALVEIHFSVVPHLPMRLL